MAATAVPVRHHLTTPLQGLLPAPEHPSITPLAPGPSALGGAGSSTGEPWPPLSPAAIALESVRRTGRSAQTGV